MGEGKKPRRSGRQLKVFIKFLVSFYVQQNETYGPADGKPSSTHSLSPTCPSCWCGYGGSSLTNGNAHSSFVRARSVQSHAYKMGLLLFPKAVGTVLKGGGLLSYRISVFPQGARDNSVTFYREHCLSGKRSQGRI